MTATDGVRRALAAATSGAALLAAFPALAAPGAGVMLEELSSVELGRRIAAGNVTTVLVPIGGTEQNGPHMALGKHNARAQVLARRIAERLGHAVVAPVVAYVPEGAIEPPTQHMRHAGTVSIPEAAFEGLLDGAARSFCHHGLRQVVLLPDHGGYLKSVERVAGKFARAGGCQVIALTAYYRATQTDYVEALKAKGFGMAEIGQHAGLADTALTLATAPAMVQMDAAAARTPGAADGVSGDPRRATAELGRLGTERIVEVSVQAIAQALRGPKAGAEAAATIAPAR